MKLRKDHKHLYESPDSGQCTYDGDYIRTDFADWDRESAWRRAFSRISYCLQSTSSALGHDSLFRRVTSS
jgi:hypothetical protein